jgi:hypothetical protein
MLASTRIPLPVGGPQHDLHRRFSGRGGCRAACVLSRAGDVSLGQAAGPEDLSQLHREGKGLEDTGRQPGLYNGFLAAGLVWALFHPNPGFAFQIKAFFLLCVIVAGAYGAATVSRRILYVQAAPAALALVLLWLA